MIGPPTLDFLVDFFTRHSPSVDGLRTILQVAFMRHFEEPLTVFVHPPSDLVNRLSSPEALPFLDTLLGRIIPTLKGPESLKRPRALLAAVDAAHNSYLDSLRRHKVALHVFLNVRGTFVANGRLKAVEDMKMTVFQILSAGLRGNLQIESRYLATMVKKCTGDERDDVFGGLSAFLDTLPPRAAAMVAPLVKLIRGGAPAAVVGAIGGWLSKFWEDAIVDIEDIPLWHIWYIGSTPFPSEVCHLSSLLLPVSITDEYADD